MAKFKVYDMAGKEVSEIELSDAIFGITPNTSAMHAAVVTHLANVRQGTQSTKTRAEVSGGGKKPWRQKGTGRARQGSIRSPQWIHGGIALGPKPRDYSKSLNRKVRKLAMLSAFSAKAAAGELVIVDKFEMDGFKTKSVVNMLDALGVNGKALAVAAEKNEKFVKSAANIATLKTALYNTIGVYDILNCKKLLLTTEAVKMIEEVYAQ